MANLGNAWHIPANPEPRGVAGMRNPVVPTAPGPPVIVSTGNQFAGGAGQGNQLQIGSSLFFKQATMASWVEAPLIFAAQIGNNKYYSGTIPQAVSSRATSCSITCASRMTTTTPPSCN